MKLKYTLFVASFILCFLGCKQNKKRSVRGIATTEKFQNVLDSIYALHKDAVGVMVHIESPEQNISWSGAAGFSEKDTGTSVEADQPVIIASNTKTYVSVAILRLVENAKLKLDDPIANLISNRTDSLLTENGYNTKEITIKYLLSHTSGIRDYAGTEVYFDMVKNNPKHQWTRDEQIELAMSIDGPLGVPNSVFAYADTNYLLLTEIIESATGQPFYEAIRMLINYQGLGLESTWFVTQEQYPEGTKLLVHQYVSSMGLDSYEIDQSFDSFGGGGLAATSKDLAVFLQSVFNDKVFRNSETKDLLFSKANPKEPMEGEYYLGLSSIDINGVKGFGHGGFWGTAVNYFPELNTTITVFILERDKRVLRLTVNEALVKLLKK
ncbi:serine hydrolase [uncultured Psychroserpens sp.]|uniref:serine hydrolase domain-containing protein n=1 Tax=uncultured Psychroserpens sp. TaxID=255436 RepID=UPI002605F3E9|nr:serine hydrolase domain-containing protein [uncultured Psychroserpens sp.]